MRESIDGATDDLPAAAVENGENSQNGEGQQAANQTDAVRQCVCKLFDSDLPGKFTSPRVHTIQLALVCCAAQVTFLFFNRRQNK